MEAKNSESVQKDTIEKQNLFLNNQMEVVLWDDKIYPIKIYCHLQSGGPTVFPHWHKELEMTCIFDGVADFYNSGVKKTIVAPGINITNSAEMHYVIPNKQAFTKKEEIVGITIQIDYSYICKLIPDSDEIYYELDSIDTEKKLVERMNRISELYLKRERLDNKIRIQAEVCEVIALLYEKCRRRKYIVPINVQKDSERTKIILEYLNEHYNENIQQQVMAKKFHFTREYFARFFKNQTGMTFKEYLTVYRIEKAKEELLYSNKNLLDIALNNGFSNETRFISNFKKYYNQTPSRFRKENKRN